jgi:hypothetical protein
MPTLSLVRYAIGLLFHWSDASQVTIVVTLVALGVEEAYYRFVCGAVLEGVFWCQPQDTALRVATLVEVV